jgi:hypothetical protein
MMKRTGKNAPELIELHAFETLRGIEMRLDHTVKLWDLSTGMESAVIKPHEHSVTAIAISSDGKLLATGGGGESKDGKFLKEIKLIVSFFIAITSRDSIISPMLLPSLLEELAFAFGLLPQMRETH